MSTGVVEGTYPRSRAAAAGSVMLVACDHVVRAATWKAPIWRTEFADEIIAIAAAAGEVGVLLLSGELARLDLASGRLLGCSPPIPRPRSLVAAGTRARFAVIHAEGATIVEGTVRYPISFDRPSAASFDAEGTKLMLAGVGRRAVEIELSERGESGLHQLPPLPAECHALARGFALLEDGVYRTASPRWLRLFEGEVGYFIVADWLGKRVAWHSGASVWFARAERGGLVEPQWLVYPDCFTIPLEALEVRGLALLQKSRLLVTLNEGRGNIVQLEPAVAFKLERHPDDAASAWSLSYGGDFLVSEDPPKKAPRQYLRTRIEDPSDLETDSAAAFAEATPDAPLDAGPAPDEGDTLCVRCQKRTSSADGARDRAGRLLCPHCPLESPACSRSIASTMTPLPPSTTSVVAVVAPRSISRRSIGWSSSSVASSRILCSRS